MNTIKIIAVDQKTSDTMSRTFSVNSVDNLKKSIEDFEKEIPYRRYELMLDGFEEDYSKDIIETLDKLEVTY